jgi:hypothetical protein
MIKFPEIDLKNKNIRIILFLLSCFLFFLNRFETNTLLSIIVMILIINQYTETKKNIDEKVINHKKEGELLLNYNNKIENFLKEIKKYKKKSPHNFKEGMYNWVQFMKHIDLLEDHNLYNYNQYFDKAHLYLQRCVNLFQALGVEAKERKLIDGAKYNDFTNSKDMMEITNIVHQLYQESHEILYNLSLRLNKKWEENPNIFNKEIVFEHPVPMDIFLSNKYDFYQ